MKDTSNFVFKEQYSSSPRVVPLFENGFLKDRSETRFFGEEEINLEKQNKHWLRIETIQMHGRPVDQYILYGSVLRQHICAVEIYNECFGNDKRKSPTRINEILNRIIGWHLGARITRTDPAYLDQKKVFYRNVE